MNKLIKLAQQKGFDEHLATLYWLEGFEEQEYMWLCLLQKWLRNECGIYVEVDCWYDLEFKDFWFGKVSTRTIVLCSRTKDCDTYEQALQEGLTKALELI